MTDLAVSFASVFVAEFGDKSRLLILAVVTRVAALRLATVLFVAVLALQTISVTVGAALAEALPATAVQVGVGVLFIAFGVWTWRGHEDDEDGSEVAAPSLLGIGLAFFLAELGDKTMLMTAALAADRSAASVWLGSVAAMTATMLLALFAGAWLMDRVSAVTVRRTSVVLFVALGVSAIVGTLSA